MCLSKNRMQQLVHECCREMIVDGNSDYSAYEWNQLEDAYMEQTDVSDCASRLDIPEAEVERIYQLFSLHVVSHSFHEFLASA